MTQPHHVTIGGDKIPEITFGNDLPFVLIAGSNTIEGRDLTMQVAEHQAKVCEKLGIPWVYKSSFDKANRSSVSSKRGVSLDEGLKILEEVRNTFKVPIITDVHTPKQATAAGEVLDMLQVPAFLCRQTDLVLACGETGKAVHVKKAQFLDPWGVSHIADKIKSTGNDKILLCERGTLFGYGNLVVDMRSFEIMKKTGYPVSFDVTHALQMPSGAGKTTGGDRSFALPMAKAAAAMGIASFFLEFHPDPENAWCEQKTQIPLHEAEEVLTQIKQFDNLAKGNA